MKHIKETQLKRSAILSPEELEYAVQEATGKNIEPQFVDYDCEDDYVIGCLSKYFEVNITSIHIDDCDLSGVWITFDKDLSLLEEASKNEEKEEENVEEMEM